MITKMPPFQDLTNKRYSRLKVLTRAKSRNKRIYWNCICDCGNNVIVEAYSLKTGRIKSCGCYRSEKRFKYPLIKHKTKMIPVTSHPLFTNYHGMKNRCYNKNLPRYKDWGGQGIIVSKEWLQSFEQFCKDMGNRPSITHSIERIDNTKGYSKQNCVWATPKEQANNQKSNLNLTYKGKTQTLAHWAHEYNLKYHALYCRLYRSKWTFEKALNYASN